MPHAGSAVLGNPWDVAMTPVREHLRRVLEGPRLLVEPTAGGGGALAATADSLVAYLDALGRDERTGVCLDNCHMHATGHDLSSAPAFTRALRAYARAAGPGTGLMHVNDSRDPVGSECDWHEAIGQGTIGREPFGAMFTAPATRAVPMVVETAGTGHAADITTLRALQT